MFNVKNTFPLLDIESVCSSILYVENDVSFPSNEMSIERNDRFKHYTDIDRAKIYKSINDLKSIIYPKSISIIYNLSQIYKISQNL